MSSKFVDMISCTKGVFNACYNFFPYLQMKPYIPFVK